MFTKKVEKQTLILLLSVCLLAGLTLTYKVFAAENRSESVEKIQEEQDFSNQAEAELEMELAERMVEPYLEKEEVKLAPLMSEEEREEIQEKKKGEAKRKRKQDIKLHNAFKVKLSNDDLKNLYRLVQSEVGFMDEKSKMLVASVVLNRVNDKKFPDTVSGVVLQKLGRVYQFSPVAPGKRFWTCTVSKETKTAVDKVLKNGDYSKGALYFVAKRYTTKGSWFDNNLSWITHHEGQDYYKERS